jgi:hypothetical protein
MLPALYVLLPCIPFAFLCKKYGIELVSYYNFVDTVACGIFAVHHLFLEARRGDSLGENFE